MEANDGYFEITKLGSDFCRIYGTRDKNQVHARGIIRPNVTITLDIQRKTVFLEVVPDQTVTHIEAGPYYEEYLGCHGIGGTEQYGREEHENTQHDSALSFHSACLHFNLRIYCIWKGAGYDPAQTGSAKIPGGKGAN
jgi:hypothetical protein